MKRLSDYKGEEAIELWVDLIDEFYEILKDDNLTEYAKGSKIRFASEILKTHKKEVSNILLRIDDTPLNGLNILTRVVDVVNEITESPELMSFFGAQGQKEEKEPSGSATETTKEKEH